MLQNTDQNSEQKRITAFHISLSLFKISSCIPIDFSTKTTDKQLIFTKPSHIQYKTITMVNFDQNKATTHLWRPYQH